MLELIKDLKDIDWDKTALRPEILSKGNMKYTIRYKEVDIRIINVVNKQQWVFILDVPLLEDSSTVTSSPGIDIRIPNHRAIHNTYTVTYEEVKALTSDALKGNLDYMVELSILPPPTTMI